MEFVKYDAEKKQQRIIQGSPSLMRIFMLNIMNWELYLI